MFRTVSMNFRLVFSGAVSVISVMILAGLSIYSLWQSELELERQFRETEAVRHEMTADMMHDAIEASIVYAILRGPESSAEKQQHIKTKLAGDIAEFHETVALLHEMQMSDKITKLVIAIEPIAEDFIVSAQGIIGLAFQDQSKALAALPHFQEAYEALEKGLEPLGKEIMHHAAVAATEAKAHDMRLLYMLLAFSAAAIIVMVVNARNVTNTITKPIGRLRLALRDVAEGDFGVRIASRMRADEFGEIARDIDTVSERVVAAMEEQNALRAENERVIECLRDGLQRLSSGDFSVNITEEFSGSYDALKENYNETVDNLNNLISEVVQASKSIQVQSNEVQNGSQDLSARTESQAATLEETAAALEMITTSVNSSAQKAKEGAEAVEVAREQVEHSGKVVKGAIEAMTEIESSSNQISQIIGVIDDIAFQTNLLALNAGVEAARAGDVGRGFAVVASEVRALAQRSSDAANEIKELIGTSSKHVQDGVQKIDGAGQALATVVTHVAQISEFVSSISSEAVDQAQGLNEVNIGVSQLDQVTQQNVSMVEKSGAAIEAMNGETVGLNQLVSQFVLRTGGNTSPASAYEQMPEPTEDFPTEDFGQMARFA